MKIWTLAAACLLGAGCREPPREVPEAVVQSAWPSNLGSEPIAPLPAPEALDPELVALGAALFDSPLLSGDGRVACSSCHSSARAYADAAPRSQGPGREPMPTNTPSLLNVAALGVFNWNGRFTSLAEHLDALIGNPRVQGTTWDAIVERLRASPEFRTRFAAAGVTEIGVEPVRSALLAFERSLASPGAAFDRWLGGDTGALSDAAREGYALFKSHGCISCHQGALVGGNVFERLGIMRPYFDGSRPVRDGDLGRFEVTGLEDDRHVFRVPSLRNVALTAPYLHDGSLPTLASVVSVMATYQLGRSLTREQIGQIVAFLESLTGAAQGAPQ